MEPGRGPFLKNTKRSSPGGPFGRFGYVKPPRARGERALGGVAAPCSTDRAGGGRAWVAGARETEPSSARRGPRVLVFPTGTSSHRAGPWSSVSWSRRFSRGSAGRWDALRTHVAPGAGRPRRVGAGAAAPGTAAPARVARADSRLVLCGGTSL